MPATSAGAGRQTVADFTTTAEEEGDRMSDMIQFVAQLTVYVGRRDSQIQRALQVLQKAQRYAPENAGEMEACTQGEWIAIDDVVKAIQILREGQQ